MSGDSEHGADFGGYLPPGVTQADADAAEQDCPLRETLHCHDADGQAYDAAGQAR